MNPARSGRHVLIQQQLGELLGPAARKCGLVPTVGEFNLGEPGNYRVPDGGLHREWRDQVFYPTAVLVVEIVSPGDDSWEKLPFYAAHDVDELLIVDSGERSVSWFARVADRYERVERSALIDTGPNDLARQIDWPAVRE